MKIYTFTDLAEAWGMTRQNVFILHRAGKIIPPGIPGTGSKVYWLEIPPKPKLKLGRPFTRKSTHALKE